MRTHTYAPMRVFRCAAKKCAETTSNWYEDGWLCLDFADAQASDEEFRKRLDKESLIEETDLVVALVCREHAPHAPSQTFIDELHAKVKAEREEREAAKQEARDQRARRRRE